MDINKMTATEVLNYLRKDVFGSMGNGLCAVTKLTMKPETVLGMLK